MGWGPLVVVQRVWGEEWTVSGVDLTIPVWQGFIQNLEIPLEVRREK